MRLNPGHHILCVLLSFIDRCLFLSLGLFNRGLHLGLGLFNPGLHLSLHLFNPGLHLSLNCFHGNLCLVLSRLKCCQCVCLRLLRRILRLLMSLLFLRKLHHIRVALLLGLSLQIRELLQLLIQGVNLPLQIRHGELHIRNCLLKLLGVLLFLFECGLGIQLCLSYLLDKYLSDLNIKYIRIVYYLLLDLLYELRLYRFFLLHRDLVHLAGIGLKKALENRIVGDHVDIHL